MALDETKVAAIVDQVLARLQSSPMGAPAVITSENEVGRRGIFNDVDQAVAAAQKAQQQLMALPLEIRDRAVAAMRKVSIERAQELSQMTVAETGLGRVEDKVKKNILAATKTPGTEILRAQAYTGDHGLTLTERAPYGVICSITPTTNATETPINNGIGMIAAGNAVVINGHPSAKGVINHTIRLLNQAMVDAGAPDNLISSVAVPTIESADKLMRHPGTALVVVTGGPGVVRAAMSTGKKCIAAGPGNPPVLVDETAHLEKAAKDIVAGASFDNNIICIVEKEILAVEAIADRLKQELIRAGAYLVRDAHVGKLTQLLVDGDHPNKRYVGKNAGVILREIGIDVPPDLRLAFFEAPESHPLVQIEQLLPVLPFVRVKNVEEGIAAGLRVEHGFRHTAVMHSLNVENLHRYASVANTSIFVKNAPSSAGLGFEGEGYTSFTIASPTGEGLTTAVHFTRERRCVLKDYFRIV